MKEKEKLRDAKLEFSSPSNASAILSIERSILGSGGHYIFHPCHTFDP